MSSWKEVYKLRAAIGKDQSSANLEERKALRTSISAMELGKAGFRKDVKNSAPLKQPDAKTESEIIGDTLDATIKKGGIEGFGASVAKVAETPVIKEVLNVLSTGGYATANIADNALDAVDNIRNGNSRGFTDMLMAAPTGIAQGLNAGIAQNREDATTFSEVIKHGMDIAGVDSNNDAAKWTQGIGGFAGDVLLDPTTYLTVGASAAAKGAVRGARQGSKAAKDLAEGAISKSKEVEELSPIKGGMNYGEIAANPKGRFGTALQEAGKDHASWKSARAQRKQDKKDQRNAANGGAINEEVGVNIAGFAANIKARNSEKVAAQGAELERQLEAEVDSAPIKTAPEILEDIKAEGEPIVDPSPVKIEETPVKSVPDTFVKEVENTIAEAPVAPVSIPEVKSSFSKHQQNQKKFEELASVFQRPKYNKPNQVKELAQPGEAKIIRQVPAPDDGTGSAFTKVPRVAKGAESTRGFIGLAAESKDAKRMREATAGSRANARLKEETVDWDNAPSLNDPKYNMVVDDEGAATKLSNNNWEDNIDDESFGAWASEHADEMLEFRKNGTIGKIKVKDFEKLVGGGNSGTVDAVIDGNMDKLVPHLFEYADPEFKPNLDANISKWREEFDGYVGGQKVAENTSPEITAEPEYDLIQKMIDVEEDNPNAWSPERAAALGIDPNDGVLSPAEIAAMKMPMTNVQIKAKIKKGDLPKATMDMLRALTGKSDPVEVGAEFIKMRKEFDTYLKNRDIAAKTARDTKEAEVSRFLDGREVVKPIQATDEQIDGIKAEATDLAEEFVKSPVAFDEPYQIEYRAMAFRDAVRGATQGIPDEDILKIYNKDTDKSGKAVLVDYAHDAVKDALSVQLKEAPHRTDGGMRTMTADVTTGGAWSPKIWGSDSQLILHTSIMRSTQKIVKDSEGAFNDYTKHRLYMSMLNVADKELRAAGVEPFLNHVDDVAGKARTNVSLHDIFSSFEEGGQLNTLLTAMFRMPSTSLGVTPIQGAVETLLRMRFKGNSEQAIRTRLKSVLTSSQAHHGRPVANDVFALNNTASRFSYLIDNNKSLQEIGDPKLLARGAKKLDAVTVNKMVDSLMDPSVYRALTYRQLINSAAHNSSLGNFVEKYADSMVERLYKLADTAGVGSAMKLFTEEMNNLKKLIDPADLEKGKQALDLKLAESVSLSERVQIQTTVPARVKLAEAVPVTVKPVSTAGKEVELYKGVFNPSKVLPSNDKRVFAVDAKGVAEAQYKSQQAVNKTHVTDAKAVETEVLEMPKPDDTEPMQVFAAQIATATAKKMHPMQKFVNPSLGLSTDVHRAVNSGLHSIARQQSHFHQSLSMHLEKYSAATLREDFTALQVAARNVAKGDVFRVTDDMPPSMHELYGIMQTMLEVSNSNVFARNGVGVKHFNAMAKSQGLNPTWEFKEGLSIYDNTHLWINEWEGIGEKGVLDFLSKMHSVAVKSSQEIAIGASFSKEFGSATKGEGLVKLRWDNRRGQDKDSSFYDLIDHDLYYPKDIAAQVIQIHNLMRESRSLNTSKPLGKFFVNVFDPVTNALKASQTTVRPGHWTISIAGDLLRNQLAGVNSVKPYQHAVRIMKAGGLDTKDFIGKIDSAEALAKYRKSQETAGSFMVNGEGDGAHFFVGNKKVKISYESLEKMLHDVVMLPKHRGGGGVIEDRFVGENVTNKLSRRLEKATDFVTDNKHFSLNSMAAQRDNFMRISLAVDYASKRKWANATEMKKGMEDYVTKWAPTSTDMTAFESKYVRRSMLYYTWLRGITPRIIDSAMTKPGITTIVPKAMYNLAWANGMNPESIGNPFPEEDGLFPSYYYNNVLGPQWKDDYGMWGINPSSPVIEVANTFAKFKLGDPAGNIGGAATQAIGMSTPFAKMPLEMAMGAQSSGIPIKDNMQYLGDNLGGSYLATLSRATGKTINQDGIVDRTDSAARGTPEDQLEHAKLQGINFLTGAKLTDYKSDSAIKAANYDIVDKMKKQVEAERRSQ